MKVLYVISKGYLNAIFKESKGYNFYIQGYDNFAQANQGLKATNSKDILGFLYIDDAIDDYDGLCDFIERVQIYDDSPLKFVIATKDKTDLKDLGADCADMDVILRGVLMQEFLDDLFIKRIFSEILIYNYQPYLTGKKEGIGFFELDNDKHLLAYNSIFPNKFPRILDPINIQYSFDETCTFDKLLKEAKRDEKYTDIYLLRLAFIAAHFNKYRDVQEVIDNCKDKTMKMVFTSIKMEIDRVYANGGINKI